MDGFDQGKETPDMTSRAHRRLRLPADDRTPAVARAAVRQVLLAGGRADQLDEALLLVSELSTNGVVHAGTPVDVDVVADDRGVTITVSDQKAGLVGVSLPPRSGPFELMPGGGPDISEVPLPDGEPVWDDVIELEERGRGLLLVDQLATSWGTTHHATGKSVWFRLGPLDPDAAPLGPSSEPPLRLVDPLPGEAVRPGAVSSAAAAAAAALTSVESAGAGADPTRPPMDHSGTVPPAAWVWLVHVPDALRARLTMPQLVSELLERLCEVTGAASGSVWLDRGDADGERRLAGYSSPRASRPPATGADVTTLVVPLPVTHPLRGSVVLHPVAGSSPGRYWAELAALSAHRMAIGIDAERLHGDDLRRRGWLTFLAEASELLANSLDVDLTLALVPQLAVPRLGGWCAVHTIAPRGGLRLAAVAHADEAGVPRLRALLGEAATREVSARLAEVVADCATVTLAGKVAGVCVPLAARGRVIGVMTVGRFPDRLHGAEDIAVVADLARRASLAIDNAGAHAERTRVAHDLQQALLPPDLPNQPGVDFGAEYVPASGGADVGGDFYDVWAVRPNRWLVSIGDVCGKGTQAAVITGVVRDVMRALVGENRSVPRMLASLNRTLLAHATDRYATVAVAMVTRVERPGRERVLEVELTLAGHDRPILVRPDGSTRAVGECGTAIGLVEQFEVTETALTLHPGESLVFVTDGVTERRTGARMYGSRRLRNVVTPLAGQGAQTIATRIRQDVVDFCVDPPRDDIAVLVLSNPAD